MKQETIDIQAALEAGQKLPFAWVRSLSQVALGRTPAFSAGTGRYGSSPGRTACVPWP